MVKATEDVLGTLHGKVAEVMLKALDHGDKYSEVYGMLTVEEIAEAKLPPPLPSAPLLSVMTKFLADNKITVAIKDSATLNTLETRLENKRAKREQRDLANVSFLSDHQKVG